MNPRCRLARPPELDTTVSSAVRASCFFECGLTLRVVAVGSTGAQTSRAKLREGDNVLLNLAPLYRGMRAFPSPCLVHLEVTAVVAAQAQLRLLDRDRAVAPFSQEPGTFEPAPPKREKMNTEVAQAPVG